MFFFVVLLVLHVLAYMYVRMHNCLEAGSMCSIFVFAQMQLWFRSLAWFSLILATLAEPWRFGARMLSVRPRRSNGSRMMMRSKPTLSACIGTLEQENVCGLCLRSCAQQLSRTSGRAMPSMANLRQQPWWKASLWLRRNTSCLALRRRLVLAWHKSKSNSILAHAAAASTADAPAESKSGRGRISCSVGNVTLAPPTVRFCGLSAQKLWSLRSTAAPAVMLCGLSAQKLCS